MRKSLIALALFSVSLATTVAAAATPSASTPTVFSSSADPNIQKAFCTYDGRCFLRDNRQMTAALSPPGLKKVPTAAKASFNPGPLLTLKSGGFIDGAYLQEAGVLPESNSYIAT